MKKALLIFTAFAIATGFYSCKKDKNEDSLTPPEDVLIGNWQLTNLDFSVMPDSGFPASDVCVMEIVSGYEFRANHQLYVILGEDGFFDPYAKDYWSWSGDKNDFEIIQNNPASPPYNFSLQPRDITFEKSDNTWILSFISDMKNGSTARFKLKKQEIALDKNPSVTDPNGESYQCNFFGQ